MNDNFEHIVYSKNVLEFVTVAGEYSNLIENADKLDKSTFLYRAQKLLPLLYLKGSLLPEVELINENEGQKFVTEDSWNYFEIILRNKFGAHNEYLEIFDPHNIHTEDPVLAGISENLCDIYQDIKDFISVFRIGNVDEMNDALFECKLNFKQYWGLKLLNSLRPIHKSIYIPDLGKEEDFDNLVDRNQNQQTDNRMISRMQQQYRNEHDEK